MKKRYLWRLKSKPDTIVHCYSDKLIKVVWSDSFHYGRYAGYFYKYCPDNMIPLRDDEIKSILNLRSYKTLSVDDIGIRPPPEVMREIPNPTKEEIEKEMNKKRYLWRFKGNPETVVHYIGDNMIQIVWSISLATGGNFNFCYNYHSSKDMIIPLSDDEVKEILRLRLERNLDIESIGILKPE